MGQFLRILAIGLAAIVVALAAALSYESRQIMKPPENDPDEFRKRGRTSPGQRVVACVGASIVHGRVSVDFVALLRQRFPAASYAFVNAGVSGDLAYNLLRRLDAVIACDPDAVVILVGTNDVQSTLSETVRRMAMRSKGVPYAPDLAHYREALDEIVARLQRESRAAVALCSLPILGEDLASPANGRVHEFNAAIRQVAAARGVAYLPVNERQEALLVELGAARGRRFTGSPRLVIAAGIQHYLLGQSLDDISRRNGLALTTDLMHMNSRGAALIAGEIEGFLRQAVDRPVADVASMA